MPKNSGYKSINSSMMKSGGCKCGCKIQTKSNHPDPLKTFKPIEKKPIQIIMKPIQEPKGKVFSV